MDFVRRPAPFVLVSTAHGSMLVNRYDYCMTGPTEGYGVGLQLLETSGFDPDEVAMVLKLLNARHQAHGQGLIAMDCGANLGVHSVEWARLMHGWGEVYAIEAQERIYYALCGNLTLNNCLNAHAIHAAVSSSAGFLEIPEPDYLSPGSFGSLELRQTAKSEFIGQQIDPKRHRRVPTVSIDGLGLRRVDLIKLDIEGMELEAIEGAAMTLDQWKPILLVEAGKTSRSAIHLMLIGKGYRIFDVSLHVLAVHSQDPALKHITFA